jgi:hypothetical protein
MPFALDGNAGRVITFPPSRTKPSMDAQGRLVDQPFESHSLGEGNPARTFYAAISRTYATALNLGDSRSLRAQARRSALSGL